MSSQGQGNRPLDARVRRPRGAKPAPKAPPVLPPSWKVAGKRVQK